MVEVESTVEVAAIELTSEAEIEELDDADDSEVVELEVDNGLTVDPTGPETAGTIVGTIDEVMRL